MGNKPWAGSALGIGIFVLLAISHGFGADNSPDTTAKYLAGLAVPGAPVEGQTSADPWINHSIELDRTWKRTEERQLPAIATWAPNFLGQAYQETDTLFYMFSGPDFLYAHAFFPNAHTYILCGTEPVGAVPDLTRLSPDALPGVLANLRKSLDSVLDWNFFITKNMKTDLTRTQLSGTLPLLYVFLARLGCTIESVSPVTLDQAGGISEGDQGETPGALIVFTSSSGSPQKLYYFCTDLSDDGIKTKPAFLRFCEQQGQGVSLLKAASYLMHEPGFIQIRNFLLARSAMIVQDDSGIPLRAIEGQKWNIRFCGQYAGPIEVFKKYWQPALAEEYARNASAPLPFGFGYRWQPNQSDLMILTPTDSRIGRDGGSASVPDSPNSASSISLPDHPNGP